MITRNIDEIIREFNSFRLRFSIRHGLLYNQEGDCSLSDARSVDKILAGAIVPGKPID